ncbi:hypothetical protein ACFFGF_12660 [Asaia lannensis]|uniref:Secreted protein n=1 Tax=Asaia lannensis NBRC 102526 TaxID=1307926 RepID=A0ABT1CGC3_9PROT|nr:hypothetical protein [Asaia lannensis]MCO6159238.1 hypothetical protein [Asaia lannensis NBRC 102526]
MSIRNLVSNTFSIMMIAGSIATVTGTAFASSQATSVTIPSDQTSIALAGPRPPPGQSWDPCAMDGDCVVKNVDSIALAGPRPPPGQSWDPCAMDGDCVVKNVDSIALAGPRPPPGQSWDPCAMDGDCVVNRAQHVALAPFSPSFG